MKQDSNVIELPIADIKVTRRREREDLGDIEGLGVSILTYGQLQPVVVDDDNELIAGFRRMTAIQGNGSTTIRALRQRDVDEITAKEMELEENLARKDMTWRERNRGLAELDRLRRMKDPNWTQVQTAVAAGGKTSQRDVSQAVKMEKMIELFPELANAKSLSKAQAMAEAKVKNVSRVISVKNAPEMYAAIEERIWLGDSVDRIKEVPDDSFHLILTDPPFGVGYEDRTAGSVVSAVSSYEDDEAKYRRILTMAPDLYRVIKPDGWLVWFLGMTWYQEVKTIFRDVGFIVDEIPLVWDRSDGRTFSTRPDRWFGKGYDIALHCLKGQPHLAQSGKSNVLRVPPVPSSERDLLVERPVELYAEIIRRLTIEGEVVADFFVGSGSCPAAAASLKRQYFGCELSEERRAKAITKIKANTPEK